MISYLCALFLVVNPAMDEEKAWVAVQKEEITLLKEEKKKLQEEIRVEKDKLHKLSLDILDRKATVRDLFPLQIQLQHKIYFLDLVEEEIQLVKDRIHQGFFNHALAQKSPN